MPAKHCCVRTGLSLGFSSSEHLCLVSAPGQTRIIPGRSSLRTAFRKHAPHGLFVSRCEETKDGRGAESRMPSFWILGLSRTGTRTGTKREYGSQSEGVGLA